LIVLPMSNCAPVLVVDGVVLVEVGEELEGTAVLFLPAQPAIPSASSTTESATATGRVCACMSLTHPPD
jgi:hypothetical protein